MAQIYNSRNYQSLLAIWLSHHGSVISTIVEIIRAYQPSIFSIPHLLRSTIVEIIRAYQPKAAFERVQALSTIVEIIRAYQPGSTEAGVYDIYNSRNYQSLLAMIVGLLYNEHLQQQKLLELTSQLDGDCTLFQIYNSRNYQSLLAFRYL